jgi:hypothetical protein
MAPDKTIENATVKERDPTGAVPRSNASPRPGSGRSGTRAIRGRPFLRRYRQGRSTPDTREPTSRNSR